MDKIFVWLNALPVLGTLIDAFVEMWRMFGYLFVAFWVLLGAGIVWGVVYLIRRRRKVPVSDPG